jgi:pectate lyase
LNFLGLNSWQAWLQAFVACSAVGFYVGSAQLASAQIKAFPQAEGFGAVSVGGRGGDVYHVTNLNNGGSGSLRFGIENAPSTGRTIVFDVGGWINLTTKLGVDTHIRNLTIAGQTAPGGIGVRGAGFSVGGDDVIVRHMRFRPGKAAGSDNDSINTNDNAARVIYDHVSAEFSTDGGFDNQATDVTLQYSSVSYGLQTHSTGALLENPSRLSLHHNLWAHNNTRNPKHRVYGLDFVNNVVYNWDSRAIELQGTESASFQWTANIDGNYFIAGANHDGVRPLSGGLTQNYETWWGTNAYDADSASDHDGIDYPFPSRGFGDVSSALTRMRTTPFPVADEIWKDAGTQAAYERVLAEFGATPWARDEVNSLLYNNVINRTGTIITRESDLPGISNAGFGTLGGVAAPTDTDGDGMPDVWEGKHGLSPTVASNNGDFDNDGYTNLEEYLNDLAAFKATGPLEFDGSGRYADWSNWTRRWEPSRVDDVHVNVGTATVDAVGQKAGNLRIGTTAAADGQLNIQSGWLEVTNEVEIGADPAAAAVLNLSGGELSAHEISKSAAGEFNFTGGTLHTDQVSFALVNNGGTLAPGHSIGATLVVGDLTLASGSLAIELASATIADTITVDGTASLGGALDVSLLGSFVPQIGDSWQIISAGNLLGSFSTVTEGYSVQKSNGNLILSFGVAPLLAGDYNDDGTVDAADYTVWRDLLNSNSPLLNETESPGVVDAADYAAWRTNFGASDGSGSVASVPEPTALGMGAVAGLLAGAFQPRRRR